MRISKNWLKAVSIAMICSITYVSCDNNENEDMVFGDFNPPNIDIMIVDEEGTNLLDPTVEGNWMDQPFQMTYLKDTYETSWIGDPILNIPPPSRLYVAYFHGLRASKYLCLKIIIGYTMKTNTNLFSGNFKEMNTRTCL